MYTVSGFAKLAVVAVDARTRVARIFESKSDRPMRQLYHNLCGNEQVFFAEEVYCTNLAAIQTSVIVYQTVLALQMLGDKKCLESGRSFGGKWGILVDFSFRRSIEQE
jgi:hypothetical protein